MSDVITIMTPSFHAARRRVAGALAACALAALSTGAARAAPLEIVYDVYTAGFPAVTLDFRLERSTATYKINGEIHTNGIADWIMHYRMITVSDGLVSGDAFSPAEHQSRSMTGHGVRSAQLRFGGGGIEASADPPSDAALTPEELAGSIDPLTAILAAGQEFAATGRCDARIKVFDGRRRYDLVLTDEGDEVLKAGFGTFSGTARRCGLEMVKFGDDPNRPRPKTTQVWLARPAPDALPLPVRIDFKSNWGPATVRLAAVKTAKIPPAPTAAAAPAPSQN